MKTQLQEAVGTMTSLAQNENSIESPFGGLPPQQMTFGNPRVQIISKQPDLLNQSSIWNDHTPNNHDQKLMMTTPLQRRAFTVNQQSGLFKPSPKQQVFQQPSSSANKPSDGSTMNQKLTQLIQHKDEVPQIRRVFLRSKAHSDINLNCSDGIIVPHTLFSILTDKQYQQVLKLNMNEPLYVSISDPRTFFNTNMNILHRHQTQSQKDGTSLQGNHNSQIFGHIHKIQETSSQARNLSLTQALLESSGKKPQARQYDDDTINLPRWMLERLKIKEGEPVCLIFDLEFTKALNIIGQGMLPAAQRLELSFSRIRKLACQRRPLNKIAIPTSAKDEESVEKFLQELRVPLNKYRFFKKEEDLQIIVNGTDIYHLTVKLIYPLSAADDKQLYLNSFPQSLDIDITNLEQLIQANVQTPTAAVLAQTDQESMDKQLQSCDLNEIIKTRGLLDLDLIEKVLEAKQKAAIVVKNKIRQDTLNQQQHQQVQPVVKQAVIIEQKKDLILIEDCKDRAVRNIPRIIGGVLTSDDQPQSQMLHSTKHLQMSQSSKTLIDKNSILLLDQSNKGPQDLQLTSDEQLGTFRTKQTTIKDEMQRLQVEFRNKKSGQVECSGVGRRRMTDLFREASPTVQSKNKLLSQEEVDILNLRGLEQKRKHLELKYKNSGTGVIYPLKEKDNIDYSQYLSDLVELGGGVETGFSRRIQKDFVRKNNHKSSVVVCPNGSQHSVDRYRKPIESQRPKTTQFGQVMIGMNLQKPVTQRIITTQAGFTLTQRPGTTFQEQRSKKHETLHRHNELLIVDQNLLKKQLDDIAMSKKGKSLVAPPPGRLSAMFNKFNMQIDRSRIVSNSIKSKPIIEPTQDILIQDNPLIGRQHRTMQSAQLISFAQRMPIFLKLRQKKVRSKPTSPYFKVNKKDTSSAFILNGGGAVGSGFKEQTKSHETKQNIHIPQSRMALFSPQPSTLNVSAPHMSQVSEHARENVDTMDRKDCKSDSNNEQDHLQQHHLFKMSNISRYGASNKKKPSLKRDTQLQERFFEDEDYNDSKLQVVSARRSLLRLPTGDLEADANLLLGMQSNTFKNVLSECGLFDQVKDRLLSNWTESSPAQLLKRESEKHANNFYMNNISSDYHQNKKIRINHQRKVVPAKPLQPVSIQLDNDYHKLASEAQRKVVLRPKAKTPSLQLVSPQMMQYRRAKCLKTLCIDNTIESRKSLKTSKAKNEPSSFSTAVVPALMQSSPSQVSGSPRKRRPVSGLTVHTPSSPSSNSPISPIPHLSNHRMSQILDTDLKQQQSKKPREASKINTCNQIHLFIHNEFPLLSESESPNNEFQVKSGKKQSRPFSS